MKMISRSEDLLAVDSPNVSKLLQLKLSLIQKLDVLRQLDNKILDMVEEDNVVMRLNSLMSSRKASTQSQSESNTH